MINNISENKLKEAFENDSLEDILLYISDLNDNSLFYRYINTKPISDIKHINDCRFIFYTLLKKNKTKSNNLVQYIIDFFPLLYGNHLDYYNNTISEKELANKITIILLNLFYNKKIDINQIKPSFLFILINITLNKKSFDELIELYNKYSFACYDISIYELLNYFGNLLLNLNKKEYTYFSKKSYQLPCVKNCIIKTKDDITYSKQIHQLFALEELKHKVKRF